ncbi:hypothetical protein LguiB_018294 [Lonicera macranthoides]
MLPLDHSIFPFSQLELWVAFLQLVKLYSNRRLSSLFVRNTGFDECLFSLLFLDCIQVLVASDCLRFVESGQSLDFVYLARNQV